MIGNFPMFSYPKNQTPAPESEHHGMPIEDEPAINLSPE
jgi:hypothetical protein